VETDEKNVPVKPCTIADCGELNFKWSPKHGTCENFLSFIENYNNLFVNKEK